MRCGWARNELSAAYHDTEWGVPLRDDRKLFELLVLEGAQAGLSWDTILAKRANYRRAFDGFDIESVAAYGEADRAACSPTPASSATASRWRRQSRTRAG